MPVTEAGTRGRPWASVRLRILVLIALAVAPCAYLIVEQSLQAREDAVAAAQDQTARAVERVENEQQRQVEVARILLRSLARVPEMRADTATCSRFAAGILADNEVYGNIGVANLQGNLVCSAVMLNGTVSASDRAWFQRARATGAFAVGDYLIGRVTGRAALTFSQPLMDANGSLTGVLFAALDLEVLGHSFTPGELPADSILMVFDSTGRILLRHPVAEPYVGSTILGNATVVDEVVRRREGTVMARGVDGVERYYSFSALDQPVASGSVFVTVGIPAEHINQQGQAAMRREATTTAIFGALALIGALGLSELAILRPTRAIGKASTRLAAGDLHARTGITYGAGELGDLARQFDRMAQAFQQLDQAKTDLVNNAAHELNTPLTPMRVHLHLLREGSHGPLLPQQQRAVEVLDRNLERLIELVRSIVLVAQLQSGRLKAGALTVRLDQLAARLIDTSLGEAARERGVEIRLALEPVEVAGDARQLENAVHAILSNAIGHSARGQQVDVRVRGGAEASMEVEDAGVGLAPAQFEALFQPFGRVHAGGREGAGMGLFLARGIARLHGGDVVAQSGGPGTGSRFTLHMPLQPPGPMREAPKSGAGPQGPSR